MCSAEIKPIQEIVLLSECMKLEEEKYKFDTSDDDDEEPLENFIDDTEGILSQCLSTKQVEDFISFFLDKNMRDIKELHNISLAVSYKIERIKINEHNTFSKLDIR